MCAREKKAKRSSYPSYRVFFYWFRPKSYKYGTGPTQERKKTGSAVKFLSMEFHLSGLAATRIVVCRHEKQNTFNVL